MRCAVCVCVCVYVLCVCIVGVCAVCARVRVRARARARVCVCVRVCCVCVASRRRNTHMWYSSVIASNRSSGAVSNLPCMIDFTPLSNVEPTTAENLRHIGTALTRFNSRESLFWRGHVG